MNKNKLYSVILAGIMIFTILIPINVLAEETDEETTTPEETASPTVVSVESVEVSPSSVSSLIVGESKKLTVSVLPSNATDSTVTWSSSDEEVATVDENGTVTAKKAGSVTIYATSNENNTKKGNCEITVIENKTEEKSTDTTIKKLTIENGTLSPSFSSSVYEYTVKVSSDVSSLDFDFTLNHSKAGYKIANNDSIRTGSIVRIVVTAEDGKTSATYKFVIEKESTNLNLKSLKIKGYTLNESFSADRLEYTADIPYEAVDVTVQAATEDSNATVTIKGATGLIVGENTVTVIIKDTSGNEREYKIIVSRSPEDEREETGNSSKYSSTTSNKTSSETSTNVTDDNGTDHTLRYAIVSIGSLILVAIGGFGIYFYVKTSTKKPKQKNKKKTQQANKVEKKEETKAMDEKIAPAKTNSIMPGDLEETREFRPDDIVKANKNADVAKDVEELLDD